LHPDVTSSALAVFTASGTAAQNLARFASCQVGERTVNSQSAFLTGNDFADVGGDRGDWLIFSIGIG
jgi:hypothetical protein